MKTSVNTNNIESNNRVNNTLPVWCKNGQHVLFEGKLHVIECAPKKEYEHLHEVIIENCETHHCHFENWDNLTPCTPDGRDLLPEPQKEITEADGVKVGDKVKHAWSDEVATVTAIRKGYWDAADGEVWLFTLDFGKDTKGEWKTVLGPFKMELNGKEFRREAFTHCVA